MSKAEYHLLYILSEPPIPVAKHKVHRWIPGNVLSAPRNSAIPPSDRFVVLDGDTDGRMVALRITELQGPVGHIDDDCLYALHNGSTGEASSSPFESSRYICFDKVYYDASIIGDGGKVDEVLVVDSLSPELMTVVISRFIKRFAAALKQPSGNGGSDRLGRNTAMSFGDANVAPGAKTSASDGAFEQLMTYAFQLPRFLNFAYTAFEESDYTAIRDFLKLPSKPISVGFNLLNCGCNEHNRKLRRSSDPTTASLWRTYDKMSHCAERLNINLPPPAILSQLNDICFAFRCLPGERVMHPFKLKPCYIQDLPHEILLSIVECFNQDWDRQDIFNFGLTCKLFHQIVNVYTYRSISISCNPAIWNEVAHVLPKHGHLTREIYLEAYQTRDNRNCYENLRAIGDFCPNLEKLDLNLPLRLNLTATEADLPPMIARQPEDVPADEDVEMPDVDHLDESGGQDVDGAHGEIAADGPQVAQDNDGIAPIINDGGTDGNVNDDENGNAVIPGNGDGDGINDDDTDSGGSDDSGEEDDGSDNDDDDGDDDDDDDENLHDTAAAQALQAQAAATQAAAAAAFQAHQGQARDLFQAERRVCAEIDHILKNCPRLDHFSVQWTGKAALERFYYKVPNLKALRLWDGLDEATLVNTAKHCRNLERFYFDGRDIYQLSADSLIAFLGALNTKEKSRLKRVGIYAPHILWHRTEPIAVDDEFFDDDDDIDGDGDMDDEIGDGDEAEHANDNPVPAVANVQQHAQQQIVDVHTLPIGRFLDTLSAKHPFLQRLCLYAMHIVDEFMPFLANFHNLTALDISRPTSQGLSAVGVAELVIAFRGKYLAALDLSGHKQVGDDDIETLTSPDGISTLRYVRVFACPALAGKFLVDEWVHPDDLILDDGTWRPRDDRGRSLLEIGDGWKEQWNEL